MDISSTIMTAKSELVVVSTSNKRKRRSGDAKDIENQRPAKKSCSPSAVDEYHYEEESTQSVNILVKTDGTLQQNQNSRGNNNNNNNSTSNNNNVSTNGVTLSVTSSTTTSIEMTPQSLKKSETWNSCIKCCPIHNTTITNTQTSDYRLCPLPVLSWADATEVWRFMCKKDEKAALDRDSKMLDNHPGLQPRMRAILLDWLIEVCEVYKLHRETYYLALDYLDRYLATKVSISKTCLQLLGITCLFIAAKVEEIYPPKLSEFAYVTDGACLEEEILQQELVILNALKWQITPVTIIGWLSVYMQLNVSKNNVPKTTTLSSSNTSVKIKTDPDDNDNHACDEKSEVADDAFVFPQFSGMEFAQTAQLIDLCTLDVGIANFSYSVIAAAAISHTFNKKIAIKLSGLDWATISPCSRWMEPFFKICAKAERLCFSENNEQIENKCGLGHVCPNIVTDESHIIQMHSTNMDMFDEAMIFKDQLHLEASPAPLRFNVEQTCPPEGLLTPPASNRKHIETQPDITYK